MPLLQLEPLEAREVPAALALAGATESRDAAAYSTIAFVGGWGSSMYQYAHSDPVAASVPTDQFALNFAKIEFDRSAPPPASDYLLTLDGIKGESSAARMVCADQRDVDARESAARSARRHRRRNRPRTTCSNWKASRANPATATTRRSRS